MSNKSWYQRNCAGRNWKKTRGYPKPASGSEDVSNMPVKAGKGMFEAKKSVNNKAGDAQMTTVRELESFREAVMSNPLPNNSEIRRLREMEAEVYGPADKEPTIVKIEKHESNVFHPTSYTVEYSDGTIKEVSKSTYRDLVDWEVR